MFKLPKGLKYRKFLKHLKYPTYLKSAQGLKSRRRRNSQTHPSTLLNLRGLLSLIDHLFPEDLFLNQIINMVMKGNEHISIYYF